MSALITAIITLISNLAPIAANAISGKYESVDQAKSDASTAVTQFMTDLGALSSVEAANDAAADAAAKGQ